jgi:hypothetical protein
MEPNGCAWLDESELPPSPGSRGRRALAERRYRKYRCRCVGLDVTFLGGLQHAARDGPPPYPWMERLRAPKPPPTVCGGPLTAADAQRPAPASSPSRVVPAILSKKGRCSFGSLFSDADLSSPTARRSCHSAVQTHLQLLRNPASSITPSPQVLAYANSPSSPTGPSPCVPTWSPERTPRPPRRGTRQAVA